MKNWLVTGGYGFIGTNFIKQSLVKYSDLIVDDIDCLTYAANLSNHNYHPRHRLHTFPLQKNKKRILELINGNSPEIIVHFAAETHVDRSIKDYNPFVETNILGTLEILEAIREADYKPILFYISTDEVYGSLSLSNDPDHKESWIEHEPYEPNSPYAASKASAEHFVRAYGTTWNQPFIITNCGNNYGPYQNVEKMIPKIITNALLDVNVPVYGKGLNVRDWIHVNDHISALHLLIDNGMIGEKYNIGGMEDQREINNIELAKIILALMLKDESLIKFVEDRKGHDLRYALDTYKLQQYGWKPQYNLIYGLLNTINWYKENDWFWRK